MDDAAFTELVDIMTEDRPPRVWSLLVTVFGELAQDRRAGISGTVIGHLCGTIGIKPEAVRVAMHRLRRDGWIESTRSGRTSNHRLSDRGRAESAKANPAIYLERPVPEAAWLVVRPPSAGADAGDAAEVQLGQNLSVSVAEAGGGDALRLPLPARTPVPGWVRERVCDAGLQAQSAVLDRKLARLRSLLGDAGRPTPLQTAVVRVLVIHEWRRLVLKAPDLPPHLYPEGWRGRQCRDHLGHLLAALGAQGIAAIERDLAA